MNLIRISVSVLLLAASAAGALTPFRTFPEQKELLSPDGRYVITSEDAVRDTRNFTGTFHTLFLEDRVSHQRRKLYDYLQRVSVAWDTPEDLIVTDYMTRRSARVLVFSVREPEPIAILDREILSRMIPSELGDHLTRNDHVFLEVVRLEPFTLVFRVWGYGPLDNNGFRLSCEYHWDSNTAVCKVPKQ